MTCATNQKCNKPKYGQGKFLSRLTCPTQCPKFNSCNAPVCPIDPDWQKRKHISGDKCCVFLLELAKTDHMINFESAGLTNLHAAISDVKDEILASSASIKRNFDRAADTNSRLNPKSLMER